MEITIIIYICLLIGICFLIYKVIVFIKNFKLDAAVDWDFEIIKKLKFHRMYDLEEGKNYSFLQKGMKIELPRYVKDADSLLVKQIFEKENSSDLGILLSDGGTLALIALIAANKGKVAFHWINHPIEQFKGLEMGVVHFLNENAENSADQYLV